MTTMLDWQKRLAEHFERLASVRRNSPKHGVFALEHGLEPAEVTELQAAVRKAALTRASESKAPLPWIVYATELGYRYSGDEYWQTFEDETPGWVGYWERGWVRDQFAWFNKKFQGVRPIGDWATHFSIICWPITNAILPRDLQVQLVRILYEMAYTLDSRLLNNPEELGLKIARHSWGTSPRFQNLVQESLLVGQIATALLLQGEGASATLLLPTTLRRIGSDLNREQQSKDWLKKARGVAIERLKVKGVAPVAGGHGASAAVRPEEEIKTIALEPKFVLRPSLTKANAWTVFLEIPNLTSVIELIPDSRDVLLQSRCIVAGTDGRPMARGRVLQGAQRIFLSKWPQSGEPLLHFDKKNAQLDSVLRSRFSMSVNSSWLFRVASDGLAYEVKGAGVRVGEKYVLLRRSGVGVSLPGATPLQVQCDGLDAFFLPVPDTLERKQIDDLKNAGISVAKGIRIWPAGVGAVSWDGEGRGEWLVTERPCFAVNCDHEIKSFEATVGQQHLQLGPVSAGETFFLAFPLLAPGRHEIALEAKYGAFVPATILGRLEIFLRPARAWEAGKGISGPLLLDVDPISPTLEQLREDRVEVSIRGPVGRELECRVRLFERGKDGAAFDKRLAKLRMPVEPLTWNRHLQKHLFGVREVEELYDSTSACEIQLQADELGILSLRFERESVPVRWAVRTRSRSRQLALVSDVAEGQSVEVTIRTFEHPDLEERQDTARYRAWQDAPVNGGLILARVGAFSSGIVLPPEVHGFSDFRLNTTVASRTRSVDAALSTLSLIKLWGCARLTGNFFSGARQRAVMRMLTGHLHFIMAGDRWEAVERAPHESPASALMHAFAGRPAELAIAKSAIDRSDYLLALPTGKRVEWLYDQCHSPLGIARVWRVTRFRNGTEKLTLDREGTPADPLWLCQLALRMASDPGCASDWAGESLRAGLIRLSEHPMIVRLARFLVIVLNKKQSNESGDPIVTLYPGWDWR